MLKTGDYVEGASTLTQQLIKMLVLSEKKKAYEKKLKKKISNQTRNIAYKEEILERYLNHVYFGHGYYGIKTAAKDISIRIYMNYLWKKWQF